MSFLEDKEWKNMDWLNQAIEPYKYSVLDILKEIPDEIVFSKAELLQMFNKGDSSTSLCKMLGKRVEQIDGDDISLYFKIVLTGEPRIDLQTDSFVGEVKIVKLPFTLDDDTVLKMTRRFVHTCFDVYRKAPSKRINDVLDILGYDDKKTSSNRKNRYGLHSFLNKEFINNPWKIRNLDLYKNSIIWITAYINSGCARSLANLSKLKCMTISGNPIYSMEEIR